MTTHPTHDTLHGELHDSAPATAVSASQLTERARRWLQGNVQFSEERCSDVVLATYEALSNCADHAYRTRAEPGAMTLQITHDADTATVQICITDHGAWIDPELHPMKTSRGRGLTLMRALADDFRIDGRGDGTTVCLHFHGCTPLVTTDQATHLRSV